MPAPHCRRTATGSTIPKPRTGRPGSRRVSNWSAGSMLGGLGVDDHPVAAGHAGEPGGHVDRGAEHVTEPQHDQAAGQPDADVGHPGVAADDRDDAFGDLVGRDRVLVDEQHRVADRLDHPAALGGDDVGAAGLEQLDQVADPLLGQLVGQCGELHDVREPDREPSRVHVLLARAECLLPGDRGGEVASPDVHEQRLERLGELLDHPQPDGQPVLGLSRLLPRHLEDPGQQRRDLPVREPGHGLPDRTGQVHREVEVDQPGVDQPHQRRQRLGVGSGEGFRSAVLRETEGPPEPTRLLEVDAGLGGELDRGVDPGLAEDVLLEVLGGFDLAP